MSTPTLVNSVSATPGGTGGTTAAIDTTGADFLVMVVAWYVAPTTTPSDSKSNTWVGGTIQTVNNQSCRIFYSYNPTVGTGHTFTFSSASSIYPAIQVLAFSGLVTSATPFDQQNGNTNTSSTTIQPGSVTPTRNNELLIAGCCHEQASYTIDSGFTEAFDIAYSGSVNMGGSAAYLIQSALAAINPTFTLAGSSANNAAAIATFKAVPDFTLAADADGTIGANTVDSDTDAAYFDDCNDTPNGLSGDYIANNLAETSTTASLRLSDVPTDFDSIDSLVMIADVDSTGFVDDTCTLTAQVYDADTGGNALTDSQQIASHADSTRTQRTVNFGSLTGTKAQWNAAYLRLTWTYTKNTGPDNAQVRLYGHLFEGFYTAAGSPTTVTVSETFNLSDSVSRTVTVLRSVSSTLNLQDSVSRGAMALSRQTTDTLNLQDSVSRTVSALRVVSDNLNLQDLKSRSGTFNRNLSDTLNLSDSVFRSGVWKRWPVDSLEFSNPDLNYINRLNLSAESLNLQDSIAAALVGDLTILVSESLNTQDSVSRVVSALRSISETLNLSDSVQRKQAAFRVVVETLNKQDAVIRAVANLRSITESLSLSDAVFRQTSPNRVVSETLNLSDSVNRDVLAKRLLSENFNLTDSVTRTGQFLRSITESLELADSLTAELAGALEILVSETLNTQDSVSRTVAALRVVSETLNLSDTAIRQASIKRLVSSSLNLSDSTSRIASYFRLVSNSLNLSDSLARKASNLRSIADSLNTQDSIIRKSQAFRSLSDILNTQDSVNRVVQYLRVVSENLQLSDSYNIESQLATALEILVSENLQTQDSVIRTVVYLRQLSDLLSLSDAATRRQAAMRFLQDTLQASDSVERAATNLRRLSDTLNLADSLASPTMNFGLVISESLNNQDALQRTAQFLRVVSESLSWLESISSSGGGVEELYDHICVGTISLAAPSANSIALASPSANSITLSQPAANTISMQEC